MIQNSQVSFAHSPDCDDAFMFYGIASGAVDTGNFAVKQIMKDIQTLNERGHRRQIRNHRHIICSLPADKRSLFTHALRG